MRGNLLNFFSKGHKKVLHDSIPLIFPCICILSINTPAYADTFAKSDTTLQSNLKNTTKSTLTTPQNNIQNLRGFGLPDGVTGYTQNSSTTTTLHQGNVGIGSRSAKELPQNYELKKGQVSVVPVTKANLGEFDFEENHFWTKRDDIINGFSIRTAQKYYEKLFDVIKNNFIRPLSYKDIANKLLEALSGFTEQITIDTTTGRILIYNKKLKLVGNYKKIEDDDKMGWVDIFINTILTLRKNSKSIGSASQDQIHYTTTLYLLKSLDENATYLDPVTNTDKQNKMSTATLGFTYRKTTSGLQVLSITKDSPTYFSEIHTGDIITHINAIPTTTLSDEQIEAILGGTNMDLMHINYVSYISQKPAETYIRKNRVVIPSTTPSLIDGLPVISIANFKPGSAHEIKQSLELLSNNIRKTGGIILDLRGNIKGEGTEAIEAANLFIDGGTILTSHRRISDPEIKTYTAKSGDILNNAPIVIMVDNTTKGTAEIFTSILEGRKRAVIIGTPTFGEGTLSNSYTLTDNSGISFATEDIENAMHISPNKTGVVPLICTSNIITDADITTLISNIKSGKFRDNRPNTQEKTAEIINNIRNSCRAIYPNPNTTNMNVKIAGKILTDHTVYKKLLGK